MSDTEDPRHVGDGALSLLAEARAHYAMMLRVMQRRIGELDGGDTPDGRDCRKVVTDYAGAVALLLQEIHKVDKHDARDRPGDWQPYDLDALRAEVGRRLARLRSAARSGDFSEFLE